MRLLTIEHQADAGPGVFLDPIAASGAELDVLRPPTHAGGWPDPTTYDGVLTFGGAMHPDAEAAHPWLAEEKAFLAGAIARGTPVLGVCLGAQLVAEAAGGRTRRARGPEIGWVRVEPEPEAASDRLLGPLAQQFDALHWHSYECLLPPGATALARSATCLQAFRVGDRAWGIQFHAEVTGADFDAWLDDTTSDPDAVAIGLEPGPLRAVTAERIGAWNALGRGLCERFLYVCERRP